MGIIYSRGGGSVDLSGYATEAYVQNSVSTASGVISQYVDIKDALEADLSYVDSKLTTTSGDIVAQGHIQEITINSDPYGELPVLGIDDFVYIGDYPLLGLGQVLFLGDAEKALSMDPENIDHRHVMLQCADAPAVSVYEWTMISGVQTGGWSWQAADFFGMQDGIYGNVFNLDTDSLSFKYWDGAESAYVVSSWYGKNGAWINGDATVSGQLIINTPPLPSGGEELIVNGNFDTTDNWDFNPAGWGLATGSGMLHIVGNTDSLEQTISGSVVPGHAYYVSLTIGRDSEPTGTDDFEGVDVALGGDGVSRTLSTTGIHTVMIPAGAVNSVFTISPAENFDGYVTGIAIQEMPENPAEIEFFNKDSPNSSVQIRASMASLGTDAGKFCGGQGVSIGNTAGQFASGAGIYIGTEAGWGSDGDDTIAIGTSALSENQGDVCIGIGEYALYRNMGSYNIAIGDQALQYHLEGDYNIAIGSLAGAAGRAGEGNILIGAQAGAQLWRGDRNLWIGTALLGSLNEVVSDTLRIESNEVYTDTPLITGDFSARYVDINGDLRVNGSSIGTITGSGTFSVSGTQIIHNLGTTSHSITVTAAGTDDFNAETVAALGTVYVKKGVTSDWVYKTGDETSDVLGFDYLIVRTN